MSLLLVVGGAGGEEGGDNNQIQGVLSQYIRQIEELRGQLVINDSQRHHSPQRHHRPMTSSTFMAAIPVGMAVGGASGKPLTEETHDVLEIARNDIEKLHQKFENKVCESFYYLLTLSLLCQSKRDKHHHHHNTSIDRTRYDTVILVSPPTHSNYSDVDKWVTHSAKFRQTAQSDDELEEEEGEEGSDTEINDVRYLRTCSSNKPFPL